MKEKKEYSAGEMKPEQDLVIAGYLGLSGTRAIAAEGESELQKRFSPRFVRDCKRLSEQSGCSETEKELLAELIRCGAVKSWYEAGEGGIMTALWNYFNEFGLGFELELRKLPIRQETVEVCEVFDVNPYRLESEGCVLLTAENGGVLAEALEQKGIHAVVVGRTRQSVGRQIHNGEIHSFLDRPRPDELERFRLTGGKR